MTPLTLRTPEVRELLASGECEVRRRIKPPGNWVSMIYDPANGILHVYDDGGPSAMIPRPLPAVGSEVWIREIYAIHSHPQEGQGVGYLIEYQADNAAATFKWDGRIRPCFSDWWVKVADDGWLPSKEMPQEASRLTATVESITAEQREGEWEWVAKIEKLTK